MPPVRLQRWLNAMIVTAVLDRVRDDDGEPMFLLKGGVAMELRLQLRARVQLELAPVEGEMGRELDRVPATPLGALQVPVPDVASCVSLRYQVAQKFHACTEVFSEGRENDRFRDVMDILLVEELLRDVGLARVREACIDIFKVRRKHPWPPAVHVYESWRAPFAELARENGFQPEGIDQAVAALTQVIAAIDAAATGGRS